MALECISLFSGAGGLDYGFEAAGFNTAVALDVDAEACDVLRENRPWPVIKGDIARVPTTAILDTAGLGIGDAAVLVGGPPCQPFSKSGYWARGDAARLRDPRARTLLGYFRVLEGALPEAFLLENVPGLAFSGKTDGLQLVMEQIEGINARQGTNYQPSYACLNAADFGIPQTRQRVFVVGNRQGKRFRFPRPTHGDIERPGGGLEPYRTSWDALGDLPAVSNEPDLGLTGKWAELLPSIPEGQNYLWHTSRGGGLPLFGWRTRYWNFLLKLSRARPAWTIQAQPGPATGPFHWSNRKLSIRELLRLQTFPDNVILRTSRASAQRLIGNAVPSALAEVLAREIQLQFFGHSPCRKRPSLIPPWRGDPPPPTPTGTVPRKYQALIGNHPPHPGVGMGRRAAALRSNTWRT